MAGSRWLREPISRFVPYRGLLPFLVLSYLAIANASQALAAGDATNPSCPAAMESSPGFRSYLPDCRAYELVTPPFKFGQNAGVRGVSENGERIAYTSLGAFGEPANDSGPEGGWYVGARNPASSWEATPVNPSASEFQGFTPILDAGQKAETIDYNTQLTETLFLQAPVGVKPVDSRFYVRQVSDGSYSEVGPLLPPAAVAEWTPREAVELGQAGLPEPEYVGASSDLHHIFFKQLIRENPEGHDIGTHWLWPGDTTGIPGTYTESLYEYTGTGNSEPELVGVENETSLAQAAREQGKAHINEAAEPVSQCGTWLGGTFRDKQLGELAEYNSLADSGETVFFTALGHQYVSGCGGELKAPEFNEVYARVNRARTVAISEPTTGPHGNCEECDDADPAQAIFQGASEDGAKVFFISAQRLLPGAGAENLYEYDLNGPEHKKLTLINGALAAALEPEPQPGGVVRIAENGSRVYLVSTAVLAHNLDALGHEAVPGADNFYVYDTETNGEADTKAGQVTFIAKLAAADGERAGNGENPLWGVIDERVAEATPDGRFLLFQSSGDLTPGSSGPGRQLYRYEAPSEAHPDGLLVRITTGEAGRSEDGNAAPAPGSSVFAPEYEARGPFPLYGRGAADAVPQAVAISGDGSRVFFRSPLALAQGALNDVCALELEGRCEAAAYNFYEWEGGHVYLLSDGQDTHFGLNTEELLGASPTGSDVFFTSTDPLVPQDTDTQVDVYDARAEGGFPAPPARTGCAGETCQGPPALAPAFGTPASATFSGPGDLAPALPATPAVKPKPKARECKRGFVKKRRGCVRKTRSKQAKKAERGVRR
jgi:hypothetical protein